MPVAASIMQEVATIPARHSNLSLETRQELQTALVLGPGLRETIGDEMIDVSFF